MAASLKRRFPRLPSHRPSNRGRRGAAGVVVAFASVAMLGMGALATEGGIWISARRNAQNAADAGALAGISTLVIRGSNATGDNSVDTVARDAVSLNSFTNGVGNATVAVEIGFWSGSAFTTPAPVGNSANAVRVTVSQTQNLGIARLISGTAPVAGGQAIAAVLQGGPACTLTLPPPTTTAQVQGRTNIAGSTTVNAPNCLMVANATGSRAMNIQNTSAAQAATIGGLRTSGQCYNCNDVMNGNMPAGYTSNAPPTPDPYKAVNQVAFPSFTCVAPTYLNATGGNSNANQAVTIALAANTVVGTGNAICTDISVGSGQTLNLTPGTYYFNGSSLQQTGGRINCVGCTIGGAGVTLVFTGNNANSVGNIRITGGEFNLNAPGTGFGTPGGYDGIVIYRDDLGKVSNAANDAIKITGNPNSTIFGAIYAPTTHVELEGTGAMNQTPTGAGGCLAVVAGELTYSGNTAININACTANGTAVTRVVYVRLVQ